MPHIALIPLLVVATIATGLFTVGDLSIDKTSGPQTEGITSDQKQRLCKIFSGFRFCIKNPSPSQPPPSIQPSHSTSPTPTPSTSPFSTPKGSSTPTPISTSVPISSGKAVIVFPATQYEGVKSHLISGDGVIVSAARAQGKQDTPIDASRLNSAINGLNKFPAGTRKILVFSSVADIKTHINSIPSDIIISYNQEGGLTPATELQGRPPDWSKPQASAIEFANIVRGAGKKAGYGPTRDIFDNLQTEGRLDEVLKVVDSIGYQGQLAYLKVGEDELVSMIKEKYNFVKSVNSNTNFQFQLWVGRQTTDQIISTFNKLSNYMDVAVIGGATSSDIITIINGLNWR